MSTITLSYEQSRAAGIFCRDADVPDGVWIRLSNAAKELEQSTAVTPQRVELSWRSSLDVVRTIAPLQRPLGFRIVTDDSSRERVQAFLSNYRLVSGAAGKVVATLAESEITAALKDRGWDMERHALKPYQLQNVQALLALPNGANFSVPGAGKTTVSFALHLLTRARADVLLVVAPRNAFPAWEEVPDECLLPTASELDRTPFVPLIGGETRIAELLREGHTRLIISYDQLVRVDALIEHFLSTHRTHLLLDESHRMKAGGMARRGAVLLRIGHLAVRRDILSGTPMPQRSADMQSQLDFLWPGAGLGSRIATGESPRQVLGQLYVRTTKQELGLPPRRRALVPVTMSQAHLAFYAVLKDDIRARASALRRGSTAVELIKARRSVVRLLQAAVNPHIVAAELLENSEPERVGLLRAVLEDGPSERIKAAADLATRLANEGKKVLIWTIFTPSVRELKNMLAHLQPAVIYGQIGLGDEDDEETRQGQIKRFKTDAACGAMIANPAAASEGMSLHHHCHDAIYVDRSYNATHFLQSIDRIHRLGLPAGVDTTVYILENKLPLGIGSIDLSVARRLALKIRAMEQLLRDPDLHELALDEEDMTGSIEASIDAQDIDDLVAELENRASPVDEENLV